MTMTMRLCSKMILMALLTASAGCSDDVVLSEFDGAVAQTTDSGTAMHTELQSTDGALLAVMDIGPTGATWTWQATDGLLRPLIITSDPRPTREQTDGAAEGATFVASLPTNPFAANQFIYNLDLEYSKMGSTPVALGFACQVNYWDNMFCIICSADCCYGWSCTDYISGQNYTGGDWGTCPPPPNQSCA